MGLLGDLGNAVRLIGDQVINGVKTFTSSPLVPTPSAPTDAANKQYVDGARSVANVFDADISAGVTYTATIPALNAAYLLIMSVATIDGTNNGETVSFKWGIDSLSNNFTPIFNVTTNYWTTWTPTMIRLLTPASGSQFQFRVDISGTSLVNAHATLVRM